MERSKRYKDDEAQKELREAIVKIKKGLPIQQWIDKPSKA
jgi:hypothetical protein